MFYETIIIGKGTIDIVLINLNMKAEMYQVKVDSRKKMRLLHYL